MALKDWKRHKKSNWYQNKDGRILTLAINPRGYYYIQVQSKRNGIFGNPYGQLYTKSQALSFAKSYMRTH